MNTTAALLWNHLSDVQDRHEVEECMREMLVDVETAETLRERLSTAITMHACHTQWAELHATVAESRAVREQDAQQQLIMADALVLELVALSHEIGHLQTIRQQHEELLVRYDEVVAKLYQAEETTGTGNNVTEEEPKAKEQQQQHQQQHGNPESSESNVEADDEPLIQDGSNEPVERTIISDAEETVVLEKLDNLYAPVTLSPSTSLPSMSKPSSTNADEAQSLVVPSEAIRPEQTRTSIDVAIPACQTDETVPALPPSPDHADAMTGTVTGSVDDSLVVLLDDHDADPDTDATGIGTRRMDDLATLSFSALEAPILSQIFTYLDALDILNVAQVNMIVYQRVDSLFGLGDVDLTLLEDTSTIATNETPTDHTTSGGTIAAASAATSGNATNALPLPTPPPPPPSDSNALHQPTVVDLIPTRPISSTAASSVAAGASNPQPTLVALPPITPKPSLSSPSVKDTTPSTVDITPTVAARVETGAATGTIAANDTAAKLQPTHAASNSADASISRFLSMLQPRRMPPTGSASASVSPIHTPPRVPRKQPATDGNGMAAMGSVSMVSEPLPMNAAMANSMAAKLSDTELHAIFQMTERLKLKESLAARLIKEKEDLAAKLDGTEGVKQFLIAKVRDMEVSLTGFVENETKVALQIASDQEVIAFLDGRVQELERESRTWQAQTEEARTSLQRMERQSSQKATVLGDMLQFEREKLTDQEREWKATKKLLVKEVKYCRAQIVALQAERDGYREENKTLRRALGMT